MFKFKKTLLPEIEEFPMGYLQPGMKLAYTKKWHYGEETYNIIIGEVISKHISYTGIREFTDLNSGGTWTEDFLLEKLRNGSCKIIYDGK